MRYQTMLILDRLEVICQLQFDEAYCSLVELLNEYAGRTLSDSRYDDARRAVRLLWAPHRSRRAETRLSLAYQGFAEARRIRDPDLTVLFHVLSELLLARQFRILTGPVRYLQALELLQERIGVRRALPGYGRLYHLVERAKPEVCDEDFRESARVIVEAAKHLNDEVLVGVALHLLKS